MISPSFRKSYIFSSLLKVSVCTLDLNKSVLWYIMLIQTSPTKSVNVGGRSQVRALCLSLKCLSHADFSLPWVRSCSQDHLTVQLCRHLLGLYARVQENLSQHLCRSLELNARGQSLFSSHLIAEVWLWLDSGHFFDFFSFSSLRTVVHVALLSLLMKVSVYCQEGLMSMSIL